MTFPSKPAFEVPIATRVDAHQHMLCGRTKILSTYLFPDPDAGLNAVIKQALKSR